ncbi:hypothetical protein EVB79_022 [Rhizobium phage RHph_N3_13]|nr:hypothetical protein EVB79_022 [Rhizobium phage RHph_N3_13]QIG69850.1 hypothetical protein F67_I3_11_024 [Rhizobium phage RHph_I3_11]
MLKRHPLRRRGWGKRKVGSYSDDPQENIKRSAQLGTIKVKCVSKGIPFDLHHSDVDWPTHCPILGIKLERNGLDGDRSSSPSIDRIIPELGYVKDNVRVISNKANRMKQNATRDELEMFSKNILDYVDGKL